MDFFLHFFPKIIILVDAAAIKNYYTENPLVY